MESPQPKPESEQSLPPQSPESLKISQLESALRQTQTDLVVVKARCFDLSEINNSLRGELARIGSKNLE